MRKPPGLSIYHPPNHKPYYTLLLTVWSISSLSLCPPKISNVPCETYAFIDCLFYIPYLFGSSSCKFHQNKTKQNKNVHGTGMFLFSSISKNFLLLRIPGHQTSLPATLSWHCHSILLEVFSNQPCSSFSSCPYYHCRWCRYLCWVSVLCHFYSHLLPSMLDFNSVFTLKAMSYYPVDFRSVTLV